MIIINFAHPITSEHQAEIEKCTGQSIEQIIEVSSQVDTKRPLATQVQEMVQQVGLSPANWQTRPIVINPPALNFSALVLIAELHGRMGYFPPIIRIKPVANAVPRRFEVAEIIDLQNTREAARTRRQAQ